MSQEHGVLCEMFVNLFNSVLSISVYTCIFLQHHLLVAMLNGNTSSQYDAAVLVCFQCCIVRKVHSLLRQKENSFILWYISPKVTYYYMKMFRMEVFLWSSVSWNQSINYQCLWLPSVIYFPIKIYEFCLFTLSFASLPPPFSFECSEKWFFLYSGTLFLI